jgi:hypothetical protein
MLRSIAEKFLLVRPDYKSRILDPWAVKVGFIGTRNALFLFGIGVEHEMMIR